MPQALSDILITEISLVDNPANPAARVVFFKRDGKQKEPTTMDYSNPMTGAMIKIAKAVVQHGFAPPSLERSDIYEAMCDGARMIAVAGETFEKSFSRYVCEFDDGRSLMAAYKKAAGPDLKAATTPVRKTVEESEAMRKLNHLATELRKIDPKLSPEQAFTKVYTDPHPGIRELVATEKRERLTKAAAVSAA
jgi:hypothetical protein